MPKHQSSKGKMSSLSDVRWWNLQGEEAWTNVMTPKDPIQVNAQSVLKSVTTKREEKKNDLQKTLVTHYCCLADTLFKE